MLNGIKETAHAQTILLVEANRASPLRDALRNEGYRVLTAHSVFEAVEEAMDSAGCDKLVNKPIRPDQLKRVVSRLLNGRTLKANA